MNRDELVGLLQKLDLSKLGEYTLVRPLGIGGQGFTAIYADGNGKLVVAKFVFTLSADSAARVEAEAECLRSIPALGPKPTFVRALSPALRLDGLPISYFFMELASGIQLSEVLTKRPGRWPPFEAVSMLWRTAVALSPAHARGIVHRDLHGGNVMVDDTLLDADFQDGIWLDPGVRILDLGVHKNLLHELFEGPGERVATFRPIGAISFASPESWTDAKKVNVASDVWALGILFYQMLTGAKPFYGASFDELRTQVLGGAYTLPALEDVSDAERYIILSLLAGMLAVNPRKRLPTSAVAAICRDLLRNNLALQSKSFIDQYLRSGGDIWLCPNCLQLCTPSGTRCTVCGQYVEDWLRWDHSPYL